MQTLRSARLLARLVLVWFALAIGAAVASPLVQPHGIELVCSGTGAMKLLVKNADGSTSEQAGHTLDCPLCATVGAPPPAQQAGAVAVQPLAHALLPIPAAHIAARTAAPPPGRGPPALS